MPNQPNKCFRKAIGKSNSYIWRILGESPGLGVEVVEESGRDKVHGGGAGRQTGCLCV